MTAAALLEEAASILAAARVDAPAWDAERLLRHVLGWDRATLVASPASEVPPAAEARCRALLARRASREPLQHLLGVQAFWRHEFLVTPDVLIPRPETERLVEVALDLVRDVEEPVIIDVGTGSGCIALSLAAEREDGEVHATDISGPALEVARQNARRLGLESRVVFHQGDLLEPVAGLEAHLVVSNPPYVDPAERDTLAPEVREHEPALALFPGGDRLCVYRRLVPAAVAVLGPGGALAVEISPAIPAAVAGLFRAAGLPEPSVHADLAGRPRVISARAGDAGGVPRVHSATPSGRLGPWA
jgi:release factor glutamine methyltransferase